jgi:hypothetical protein
LTVFRDALTAATANHGQDYPGEGGINVKAVAILRVREEFKRLHPYTGDDCDRVQTQGKAFRRALEKARDEGVIGGEGDLIWFV